MTVGESWVRGWVGKAGNEKSGEVGGRTPWALPLLRISPLGNVPPCLWVSAALSLLYQYQLYLKMVSLFTCWKLPLLCPIPEYQVPI